jgi:hypothetical protein
MTDLAAALADTSHLADFEGLAVRQSGIEIPGAAGGLRDPMKIDPQAFRKGERVYVVLECLVDKVRFDPIDHSEPAGDQRRVHVFSVQAATIVDGELVQDHLEAQRVRIERAKDAARGQAKLPTPEELTEAHVQGEHADALIPGCPQCDEETAAAAAEVAEPTPIAGRRGRKAGQG